MPGRLRHSSCLEPEHGAAWAFRGLCEFKLTEYAPALEHLTRANDLGVGDDASFLAVVGYHRAILLARFEQFERALDLNAGFIRGGNTSSTIVEALGITLLRLPLLPSEVPPEKREMVEMAGRAGLYAIGMMRDAAERTFQQLVSKYPDAPNVHYVYGTYLMGDRPAEALEQFNIELQRSPEHVLARVQIAQELIKQGEFDRASPYATEAARLGRTTSWPAGSSASSSCRRETPAARLRTWKRHARSSRPAPVFAITSRARISGPAGVTTPRESARSSRAWRVFSSASVAGQIPSARNRRRTRDASGPAETLAAYTKTHGDRSRRGEVLGYMVSGASELEA